MNQLSLPQIARIEQDFGLPSPIVHCPICGKKIFDEKEIDYTPCKHLSFVYIAMVNEYAYASHKFARKIQKINEDKNLWDIPLDEKLIEVGYGNNLLVLEITYGGIACGPVWHTDSYGFDYDPLGA